MSNKKPQTWAELRPELLGLGFDERHISAFKDRYAFDVFVNSVLRPMEKAVEGGADLGKLVEALKASQNLKPKQIDKLAGKFTAEPKAAAASSPEPSTTSPVIA